MISADATRDSALDSAVRGSCTLVTLYFPSGTQRYNSGSFNISYGGNNFNGLGSLLSISKLKDSENTGTEMMELTLSIVDNAMFALMIGEASAYRNARVTIDIGVYDEAFRPQGAVIPRWSGYISHIKVERETAKDGPSKGSLKVYCARGGLARLRNVQGLRLTDAQQQQRFPGDKGLEYIPSLIEKPVPWITVRFQQV